MHNNSIIEYFWALLGKISVGLMMILEKGYKNGNDLTNVGIMLLFGYSNEYTFQFWCKYHISVLVVFVRMRRV